MRLHSLLLTRRMAARQPPEVPRVASAHRPAIQDRNATSFSAIEPEHLLSALGPHDVVVTARGDKHDFVSRYIWPANGGDEDPVTRIYSHGACTIMVRPFGQVSTRGHAGVTAQRDTSFSRTKRPGVYLWSGCSIS